MDPDGIGNAGWKRERFFLGLSSSAPRSRFPKGEFLSPDIVLWSTGGKEESGVAREGENEHGLGRRMVVWGIKH